MLSLFRRPAPGTRISCLCMRYRIMVDGLILGIVMDRAGPDAFDMLNRTIHL